MPVTSGQIIQKNISWNIPNTKQTVRVVEVGECLPCNCEAWVHTIVLQKSNKLTFLIILETLANDVVFCLICYMTFSPLCINGILSFLLSVWWASKSHINTDWHIVQFLFLVSTVMWLLQTRLFTSILQYWLLHGIM
jgi:hypothetical protein